MQMAFIIQFLILTVFISRLNRSVNEGWLTGESMETDDAAKSEGEKIRSAIQDDELKLLSENFKFSTFDTKDIIDLTKDRLLRAIDYAIRRHDWYEDQRSRIFQQVMTISFAVLTVALAVASLVIQKEIKAQEVFPTLGGIVILACICIPRCASLYNAELNANRPYRLISDIRFWFFRYNLPSASRKANSRDDWIALVEGIASERRRFFTRVSESFAPRQAMREDIEQLFILQVLQRSKHESLLRLQWLLSDLAFFISIEVAIVFSTLAIKFLCQI